LRKFLSVFALAILVGALIPSIGTAQVPPPATPDPLSPPSTPGPTETPGPTLPIPSSFVPTGSPEYGAAAFVLGYPESTQRDLDLMKAAGLTWLRLDVPWRSIEPDLKHNIDWDDLDRVVTAANAAGIKIMVRVDHPPEWARAIPAENGPPDNMFDYADFVSEMARRYRNGGPRGTIHAIQVWNEPNLNREWGGAGVIIDRNQASQYIYMLKETYIMVKAQDPTKIIVSAGLSPTGTNDGTAQPDDIYLGWLYEDGLARITDAIGVHAPGYGSPPEAELNSNPAFPHPSFYFRRVEQLRAVMEANGDFGKQIWINEFGWTTDTVHPDRAFYAVTPEQQADYIVQAFRYARQTWAPWVGPMFVWNIPDPTWAPDAAGVYPEQWYWGITNTDGTPRPAYTALANARLGPGHVLASGERVQLP
jgi:polysaccharide biosynthesis protein PslG